MKSRSDEKGFEFIPSDYELPQLYFGDNRICLEHSKIPSGVPDVERVIAGHQDFWCIEGEAKNKQPKTIVLGCDWSIQNWSPEKKKNVAFLLEGLLKAGFSFLAVVGPEHTIKPITSMDELSAIYNDAHFTIPAEVSKKIAEEKNLPVDGLLILDYFELNKLLSDASMMVSNHKEDDIYALHILNSKFKTEVMEQLIHRNKKSNIIINENILSNFLSILNEEAAGSEIRLSVTLDKDSNQNEIINLIEYQNIISSLEFRSIKDEDFDLFLKQIREGNLKFLPSCENLTITNSQNNNRINRACLDLEILLSIIPNLKSLDLHDNDLNDVRISFHNINLSQVKNLKLFRSAINALLLQNLLTQMVNIEALDLYSDLDFNLGHSQVFTQSWLKTNPHVLKNIKSINLTNSDIQADQLQNILTHMLDLEELTLTSCQATKNAFTKEWLDEHDELFKKITKLNLENTDISPEALQDIISRMPLLKELNLSGCKNIASAFNESWFEDHPDALKNLKRLSLNRTDINTISLLEFFSRCTHIEFLQLWECNEIKGYIPKEWLNLNPNALKKLLKIQTFKNKKTFYHTLSQIFLNISIPSLIAEGSSDKQDVDTLRKWGKVSDKLNNLAPGKKPYKISYNSEEFSYFYSNNPREHRVDNSNLKNINERPLKSLDLKLIQELMNASALKKNAGMPIRQNQEGMIDADTQNVNSHFDLKQIFFATNNEPSPHPSTYRLSVFSEYELNKSRVNKDKAFSVHNKGKEDPLFIACHAKRMNNDVFAEAKHNKKSESNSHFYAKTTLTIDKEWQALPSLSANEKLLCYHLNDANVTCEIEYSKRDNLYYIRNKKNIQSNITIDYLIEVPQTKISKSSVPSVVVDLVDFYTNFGEGELKFQGPGTGQDYIDAINSETKGACRHRAIAFKDAFEKLKRKLSQQGFPHAQCRTVMNDCHAFVEIRLALDEPWIAYNLGGYQAELNIDETNRPKELPESKIEEQPQFDIEIKKEGRPSDVPVLPPSIENGSRFVTWKTTSDETNLKSYLLHLTSAPEKKPLIDFNSKDDIQDFVPVLLNHIHHTGHSVFYINSPDDFICSSPYLSLDGKGLGKIQPGPGGPLHHFLTTNPDKKKTLVINWANFTAAEIARFNSIIDEDDPQIDDIKIPDNTKIISLYSSSDATMDKAFGRRIDIKTKNPIPAKEIKSAAQSLPSMVRDRDTQLPVHHNIPPIELYQSSNWKNYLLGKWEFHDHEMIFVKGPLLKALEQGQKRIVVNNGLWDQFEFQLFWQQLQSDKGLTLYGQHFALPDGFQVERTEGYDWANLALQHTWFNECPPQYDMNSFILNPTSLPHLITRYVTHDKTKSLTQKRGLLEKNKNGSLTLQITRSLTTDQWGLLLQQAKDHNVKLTIEVLAGIKIPTVFQQYISAKQDTPSKEIAKKCILFKTNDRDATIVKLCKFEEHDKPFILDISEYKPEDIFFSCNPEFTNIDDQYKILFHSKISDVWEALQNEKTVILTGQFSAAMVDHLSSLILQDSYYLNGKKVSHSGKLIIVTENATLFQGMPIIEEHIELENNVPYVKQITLEKFNNAKKLNPHLQIDYPWNGLISSDSTNNYLSILDNEIDDESFCEKFDRIRIKQMEDVWTYSPFTFLAGKTGVGKSSFVRSVLGNLDQYKVYYEEKELLDWIKDDTDNIIKILFIDEANLSSTDWSRFEGLFHDPPRLLIGSEWIKLTDKHKVIFAGNPLNYGGERHLATLFERHGGTTTFTPLPARYVAHRILRPLLKPLSPKLQDRIINDCLNLYNYIVSLPYEEVLITPRELEMIALLAMARLSQPLSEEELNSLMCSSIYTVMANLIPKNDKASFSAFLENMTGIKISELPHRYPVNLENDYLPEKFVLTEGVKSGPFHVLRECLNLRTFRQQHFNSAQQNGGLRSIIIEGESGVGKSQVAKKTLVAHGLKKLKIAPKIPLYVAMENLDANMLASLGQKKAYILSNNKLYFVNKNTLEELDVSEKDLLKFQESINIGQLQLTEKPVQVISELSNKQLMQITYISGHVHYNKQGFYHIPPGMRHHLKEELIEKALHEGAVVLIDEINTGSMMEATFNAVSMGYDRNHRRARHSGFMFVATQNAIDMGGRRPATDAIKHRTIKTYFPNYSEEDLYQIITKQYNLTKKQANDVFVDYINASRYAKLHHKEPAPTPGHLFKMCAHIEKQNEPLQNIASNQIKHKINYLAQARNVKFTYQKNEIVNLSNINANKNKTAEQLSQSADILIPSVDALQPQKNVNFNETHDLLIEREEEIDADNTSKPYELFRDSLAFSQELAQKNLKLNEEVASGNALEEIKEDLMESAPYKHLIAHMAQSNKWRQINAYLVGIKSATTIEDLITAVHKDPKDVPFKLISLSDEEKEALRRIAEKENEPLRKRALNLAIKQPDEMVWKYEKSMRENTGWGFYGWFNERGRSQTETYALELEDVLNNLLAQKNKHLF